MASNVTSPRWHLPTRAIALLQTYWAAVLATIIAACLLLCKLDVHVFWSDEALTAGYARSLLHSPLPTAWDGRNLLCYDEGGSLTPDLLATRYPQLQFYAVWPFFRAFGVSETTGRLPFALAALLTVPLTYLLGLRLFGSRSTAGFGAVLLALNVQFLLFSRQCRYYALTLLFSVACLLVFKRLDLKRRWPLLGFFALGLLLFHSHFMIFFCFMGGLTVAYVALDRARSRFWPFVISGTALLLCTVPWVLWVAGSEIGSGGDGVSHNPLRLLWWYLRDMHRALIFPALAVPFLGVALWNGWKRKSERRNALMLMALCVAQLAFVCVVTIQDMGITNEADLRYAANLIPFCCLLLGYACSRIEHLMRGAGVLLCGVMAFTTILAPDQPFRCLPLDYARELGKPYSTSTKMALKALDEVAEDDDIVIVEPSRFDMRTPLVFYLGHRLRFASILPADSPLVAANPELPPYVYSATVEPDWLVKFRMRNIREDIHNELARKGFGMDTARLNIYWRDQSRPELIWHRFEPVMEFSYSRGVFIQRVTKPDVAAPKPSTSRSSATP